MKQLSLPFLREQAVYVELQPGLVCAFGTDWLAHFDGRGCVACDAESARLEAEFRAGVKAGIWDERGFKQRKKRP